MKNKIKIIHYIPGFDTGGIESRLLDWYENMDRDKIEFIVIRMTTNNSDKVKELQKINGKFHTIPNFNLKNIIKYFKKMVEILKKEKPDIVHVHCMNTGLFCLMIAKICKIKTRILHSRSTDFLPNEKNIFIKKIIKKLTPIFATDYFACSYEAGIWGNGKRNAEKTIVIKNGIELPNFYFNQKTREDIREKLGLENKKIIGTIGRLSPQKNLLFLLDVFNEISKKDLTNKYVLMLIGDGQMLEEINNRIKKYKIENKVILLSSKSDVWNYYMAFDVFVATSFYEGFGTTAVEAQATGLITLLSTGFPESVVLSNYAYRLSLDKEPTYWADMILSLNSRTRTQKDAENIEQKGYSAKSVAKNLEKLYIDKFSTRTDNER